MIKLNNDYKNIYNKIKNLEEHFLDCKKPLDSEADVKMYETLLMIYMGLDKEYSPNTKLYKNKFVHFSSVDKDNSIQKKSMEELINNKDRHSKLILDFIDIKSALEYSYGMMIAFSMLDDKTLYDKFQMIRDPYFDKGKLDSIGLDDDKISKVMVKKMTNYFKK